MIEFALRDGVHLAWTGDIAIFLDVDADRYACLGPQHTALLRHGLSRGQTVAAPEAKAPEAKTPEAKTPAAEAPEADAPEAEAPEAEAPEAEAPEAEAPEAEALEAEALDEEAWASLAQSLARSRLVVEMPASRARASRRSNDTAPRASRALVQDQPRPGVVATARVLLASAQARRALKRPLRAVVAAQVASTGRAREVDGATAAQIARVAEQFIGARGWFVARDACLAEALSLLLCLRADGLHAHWVFGVSAPPFEAHCWVQSGDLILNDTLDHVARYTPILVA